MQRDGEVDFDSQFIAHLGVYKKIFLKEAKTRGREFLWRELSMLGVALT